MIELPPRQPPAGITRVWLLKVLNAAGPEDRADARRIMDEVVGWFPPTTQIGNRDFLDVLEAVLLAALSEELLNGP